MQFDIDDITLILSNELVNMTISSATVEVDYDPDGDIVIYDLRIDGRPFPLRGGKPDPFDLVFANKILASLYSKSWLDHFREYLDPPDLVPDEPDRLHEREMM